METKGATGNEKKNGELKKSSREEKQRDAKIEDQIEKVWALRLIHKPTNNSINL